MAGDVWRRCGAWRVKEKNFAPSGEEGVTAMSLEIEGKTRAEINTQNKKARIECQFKLKYKTHWLGEVVGKILKLFYALS